MNHIKLLLEMTKTLPDHFVIYKKRAPGEEPVGLTLGDLRLLYETFLSQSQGQTARTVAQSGNT